MDDPKLIEFLQAWEREIEPPFRVIPELEFQEIIRRLYRRSDIIKNWDSSGQLESFSLGKIQVAIQKRANRPTGFWTVDFQFLRYTFKP